MSESEADLAAIREALGVSDDMTIAAIVCAILQMRQENAKALRMEGALYRIIELAEETGYGLFGNIARGALK